MNTPEKNFFEENEEKLNTIFQEETPDSRQYSRNSEHGKTPPQKHASISRRKKLALRRKRLRQKQVKRQKLMLAGIGFILLLTICWNRLLTGYQHQTEFFINSSCESYRTNVEEVSSRYGMSDYVDLILALMMQESSGQGLDVLQASEGAYNKKYPQVPNGITDVDYSIECGIQELKYALDKAEVTGPKDIKRIRLALQAYNFGADAYFSYLEKNGISSWSEESTEAFAQMASEGNARSEDDPLSKTAGPWDYGDQKYPEHVLRYYHP